MVRTLCNVRFAAADSRGNSDEKSASQRIVAARATRTPTKRSEMVVIGRALARIVIGLKSVCLGLPVAPADRASPSHLQA